MKKWKLPSLLTERLLEQQNALFPLSFVFSSTTNLVFFYLGFGFQENIVRQFGFILVCVCFAVCCGLTLLSVLQKRLLSRHTLVLLSCVVLFFAGCYGISFWKFGFRQGIMLENAEKYIILSLPAFFSGICAAAEREEERFFPVLESVSFLAAPGALIYANSAIFHCLPWNYNANLGVLSYMVIAYTFMPYLLAHMIGFVRDSAWSVPFMGRPVKRPQLLRGGIIALYWIAIIASATRGAIVCVVFFCILLTALELLQRTKAVKRAAAVSAAMITLLLFYLFVPAPVIPQRLSRMNTFLEGLSQGQIVTTNKDNDTAAEWLDELVQADGGRQFTNFSEDREPTELDPNDIATFGLRVGDRATLFKLAYKEFLKSPLTGMSPGGYSVKYGIYPHIAFLELLCETGLIGTSILLVILLWVFSKLILCSFCRGKEKSFEMPYMLLFFVVYALQANISGIIWDCPALMAALGFGIVLRLPVRHSGRS